MDPCTAGSCVPDCKNLQVGTCDGSKSITEMWIGSDEFEEKGLVTTCLKKKRLRSPSLAACIKGRSPEREGPTTQTKRKRWHRSLHQQ
eukprot:1143692-Pelagomonas_calceolata.AAC.4